MTKLKRFFIRQSALKKELTRLIKRNEYLELSKKRQDEKQEGLFELMKIYEGVILYLGEKLMEKDSSLKDDFHERIGEILKLIRI